VPVSDRYHKRAAAQFRQPERQHAANIREQPLPATNLMSTREVIEQYLDRLHRKDGWQDSFASDISFASFVSPMRRLNGREEVLHGARIFYGMIASFTTRDFIVEGDRACVTNHYELQPPGGKPFSSDVAEVYLVRDGKIKALEIYFDMTPYPRP
jgi:ketosteroid isomerase-like protein